MNTNTTEKERLLQHGDRLRRASHWEAIQHQRPGAIEHELHPRGSARLHCASGSARIRDVYLVSVCCGVVDSILCAPSIGVFLRESHVSAWMFTFLPAGYDTALAAVLSVCCLGFCLPTGCSVSGPCCILRVPSPSLLPCVPTVVSLSHLPGDRPSDKRYKTRPAHVSSLFWCHANLAQFFYCSARESLRFKSGVLPGSDF